jgi:hypothetical protein
MKRPADVGLSPYPGTTRILGQEDGRKKDRDAWLTDNFNRNYVRFPTDALSEVDVRFPTLSRNALEVARKEESQRRARLRVALFA